MLVCHCNGITDRPIRRAVREGASSVADVGFACGAGTCCGGCTDNIERIIHNESSQRDELSVVSATGTALRS